MNLIIDGSNALHRAFWVAETRSPLVNNDGVWTGPSFIFLRGLKSLVDQFKPESIWVTWDKRLSFPSTNFRKQLSPDAYKQNRDQEKIARVHEQHDIISEYLMSLGVKQIYPWVLEADDIISYLVKEKLTPCTIVSVDKDLLQLIDTNTKYYNPIKKKLITIYNFEEECGVNINDFLNYKALLGDKSDNIIGIEGYGIMKSKKLAQEGIDAILNTLNEQNKELFKHNLLMMDLNKSYEKEVNEKEMYEKQFNEQNSICKPDLNKFKELCITAKIPSFVREIDKWKQSFSRDNSLLDLLSRL